MVVSLRFVVVVGGSGGSGGGSGGDGGYSGSVGFLFQFFVL